MNTLFIELNEALEVVYRLAQGAAKNDYEREAVNTFHDWIVNVEVREDE